jgi:hypothetical protein
MVHIDDDLWPEPGAPSPPNSIVIEVTVTSEALEMLAPA